MAASQYLQILPFNICSCAFHIDQHFQVSYEPTTLNSEQELRELGLRKGISTVAETHAAWSLNFTSWDSFIFFF